VSGLAFIRDGKALVTSGASATGDSTIRLWDARTGAEIIPDRGHTTGIASSVLLPDGRTLVTGSDDNTVRWWNLATGNELRRVANRTDAAQRWGMALSPDGAMAAYHVEKGVSEREAHTGIELWDLTTKKKLALLWRPNIFTAQFSPDGKTLFTDLWDVNSKPMASRILSWNVATGKELRVLAKSENSYGSFSLSADGKVLAATTRTVKNTIDVWDVATGKELGRLPGDPEFIQCLAISPDNKILAVADGGRPQPDSRNPPHNIRLWDIATGKEVRRFGSSSRGYSQVAFSPDGRTLATAGHDNRLRLWETATGGERLQLAGHAGRVANLLFAEEGRTLVSTSSDTTALVWDLTGLRRPTPAAGGKRPSRDLQDLWNALADRDAATAYRAVWALTATPSETVAFLHKHLRRVEPPEERAVAQLVRDLDSPVFATRQRASEELAKLDRLAEPALRQALAGQPSLEVRRRVQQLLEHLEAVPSGDQLRSLRAVEALERIGTRPAREVLEALAGGAPNARLTRDAQAALRR
jgi:WD40 repeat protein